MTGTELIAKLEEPLRKKVCGADSILSKTGEIHFKEMSVSHFILSTGNFLTAGMKALLSPDAVKKD